MRRRVIGGGQTLVAHDEEETPSSYAIIRQCGFLIQLIMLDPAEPR